MQEQSSGMDILCTPVKNKVHLVAYFGDFLKRPLLFVVRCFPLRLYS